MMHAWCAVPLDDGDTVAIYMHRGIFTQDDFADYYVKLASRKLVLLNADPESHETQASIVSKENANSMYGVCALWQCACCQQYKAEHYTGLIVC